MTKKQGVPKAVKAYLSGLARRGGKARTSAMSPAERSALARTASQARWRKRGAK